MSRSVPVLAAAMAILALAAPPLRAQAVLGRVVAESTGAPLEGVFITLSNDDGERAAGFLSRADGRFLIRSHSPGTYQLRAELIGYRSMSVEVQLPMESTVRLTLELALEAVELEGIVARASRERRCRLDADEGDALTRLWEEARKSLRIADWAAESGWIRARGYTYQRVLDLVDLEVLTESVRPVRELERTAFTAADPATLRSQGFVVRQEDGSALYRGADAHLLLSDAFQQTHCFRLIQSRDGSLLGLAFEPVDGREPVDIEGVLWLDAETARLEHLEYGYTRYPVTVPLPESRYGGETHFRHLPGGGVTVERWWIRMPSLRHWADPAELRSARRCGMAACDDRATLRTLSRAGLAIEQEGGEVLELRQADGTRLPAADQAVIAGVVVDSTAPGEPAPLAGAEVRIEGTDHRAVSDDRGRFRLEHLPEGTYRLQLHHPRLAMLAIERPAPVVVRAVPGEVARTRLGTPSLATRAAAECAARAARTGTILHGVIRDAASGATLHGARVRLIGGGREQETDATGHYVFCLDRPGAVTLAGDYLGRGQHTVEVEAGGLATRVDLELDIAATGTLTGRVVHADDANAALEGVMVEAVGLGRRVVTKERGAFRFDSVPAGTLTLETRHIAYATGGGQVEVRAGESVDVELRLAEHVIAVEPIVVTARRQPLLMEERMRGYYVRQARGLGTFLGPEALSGRPGAGVTELVREASSFRTSRTPAGRILTSSRVGGGASGQNPFCSPMIYLDGVRITNRMGAPVLPGGPPDPTPLAEAVRMIDAIPASELAGIEIYPGAGSVPGEFAGLDTQCGVVAVWTRSSDHSPR